MMDCEIPIFLAADDNYAPFVLTTILSVLDHTKSFCCFYVLSDGISDDNKKIISENLELYSNFSLKFVDISSEYTENFEIMGHQTLATYYRFWIADMFPNLSKAIYLDVDVIVTGDIRELFDTDLGECVLGAVPDMGNRQHLDNVKRHIGMSIDYEYFNAGVMLMDLDRWRENNITDKLLEIEKIHHGHLLHNDQDILNIYFTNSYQELSMRFNSMKSVIPNCIIRHYADKPKPWEIKPELCVKLFENYKLFWSYATRTSFYEMLLRKCKYTAIQQIHLLILYKNNCEEQDI